jgi:Mg-chelatase subunit ChlD
MFDVSGSMSENDYPPNRLAGAIEAAAEYGKARAEQSPDDRIAVVTFNETAQIVLPLTHILEKQKILSAICQLKAGGGTDIAEGLKAAMRVFDMQPLAHRLRQAILLTDGDGGNPLPKATILKAQYGAVIDVAGIGGTPEAVRESLLREVATTDPDGFNHYRLIKDS